MYLGLVVDMKLKFYSSVEKVRKSLKVRKFRGLISMFGEVTGNKLCG